MRAPAAAVMGAVVVAAGAHAAPLDSRHPKAANAAYHLPLTGTLTGEDLFGFATLLLDARTDQFSPPFDTSPLIGRDIEASTPTESYGSAKWAYDRDAGVLTMTVDGFGFGALDFMGLSGDTSHDLDWWAKWKSTNVLPVAHRVLDQGHELRQNAFGAKADVTTFRGRYVYLAELTLAGSSQVSVLDQPLTLTARMAPEDARRATAGMRLVAHAVAIKGDNGSAMRCGGFIDKATIDSPTELWGDRCIVTVRLTRLAFVDGDGRTIAAWTPSSTPTVPVAPTSQAPGALKFGTILLGMTVYSVAAGSIAAEGGLKPGDLIETFDGEAVEDQAALRPLVQRASPGQVVTATVRRGARETRLTFHF